MTELDPPHRLLIDTDPGVDDSMAILLAFSSPELQVEALTTVFGNTGSDVTTTNALRLVELVDRGDVPVARGAEHPLLRPFVGEGWRVHGKNGLGGADFPPPRGTPDPRRGAQLIVDRVMAEPGALTIVAVGPLTNLAIALALEPRIAGAVREVVIMGGAVDGRGNASTVAEANIRNDPEAAWLVFHAGWPLTMVGLDVTRQVVMDEPYMARLAEARNPRTDFISRITPHYMSFYKGERGVAGFYVHDSSAIAYLIDRSLFETRPLFVDVERVSPLHFGQTVADWEGKRGEPPNVQVALEVDSERLLALYTQRLTEPMP